jgi:hypothetical protein
MEASLQRGASQSGFCRTGFLSGMIEGFLEQRGDAFGFVFERLQLFLRRTQLIRQVQAGENGHARRIPRRAAVGDREHQFVDLVRDLVDILRIAVDEKRIALIKDLDPDRLPGHDCAVTILPVRLCYSGEPKPVMTISEMLLPAFDQEMANTRAILDCVPGEKFSWKPHEKSVTMSRLASHIASGVKKQIHPLILHHFIPIPIRYKPGVAGCFLSQSYGTISDFESSIPCRSCCLPEGVIV